MKNLFLLYTCAEKFRAAKISAINVSLSLEASMAEFYVAKRKDAMKILEFLRKQTERGLEILKFLSARYFGSHKQAAGRRSEILKFSAAESSKSRFEPQKQAAEFLKFSPMPCNRFGILIKTSFGGAILRRSYERGRAMGFLKFTHALARLTNAVQNFITQHRFRILKFVPGCVHYAHIAQNFISKCGFKILKFIHKPLHALRHALTRALRCTSLRADKAEAGRAARLTSQHTYDAVEKWRAVKFNHASGLDSAQRRIARLCSAAARRNYEAWRSEIYAVCLHKYSALIRAASGKISRYEVGRATNVLLSRGVQRMKFYALNRHTMKFLKFLAARSFGLQRATELLNLTLAPSRNGFEILKFTRVSARLADTAQNFILQRGFKILKFIQELPFAPRCVLPRVDSAETGRTARLTSQHTHDATEKRRAVKINQYLNSARRRIVRLRSAAARHGYEVGRTEKFSKFSLTNAFLNFISLPPRKFKLVLLKFSPEPPRNGFRILKFTPELSNRFEILKFTFAPHKFKPALAVRLNFALNSVPHASASKFENGVKFKGAAKFERSAR